MNIPVHRLLLSKVAMHIQARIEIRHREAIQIQGHGGMDPLILRHRNWLKARAEKGLP